MCYYCAERFGWTPKQTLEQDETIISDLLQFDKQVSWQKWANRHDIEDDDEPKGNDEPFGMNWQELLRSNG